MKTKKAIEAERKEELMKNVGVGGIGKYHTTVFKIKNCGITKY